MGREMYWDKDANQFFPVPDVVGSDNNVLTNADRIRNMSDEELAEWLDHHVSCARCPLCEKCIFDKSCSENLQAWLKEEVKDD